MADGPTVKPAIPSQAVTRQSEVSRIVRKNRELRYEKNCWAAIHADAEAAEAAMRRAMRSRTWVSTPGELAATGQEYTPDAKSADSMRVGLSPLTRPATGRVGQLVGSPSGAEFLPLPPGLTMSGRPGGFPSRIVFTSASKLRMAGVSTVTRRSRGGLYGFLVVIAFSLLEVVSTIARPDCPSSLGIRGRSGEGDAGGHRHGGRTLANHVPDRWPPIRPSLLGRAGAVWLKPTTGWPETADKQYLGAVGRRAAPRGQPEMLSDSGPMPSSRVACQTKESGYQNHR